MKSNLAVQVEESRIVAYSPDTFGGEYAAAFFDEDYEGKVCVISLYSIVAIVPNVKEALMIAAYAITPNGGFGSVDLLPAPDSALTHATFDEWLD